MGKLNPQNLKPVKTVEEAREKGRNGGIKSGIAKRKKKLITEIYIKFLAKKFDIIIDEKKKKLSGNQLLDYVMQEILLKGDSASVALLKEIRQAIEGGDDPENPKKITPVQINIITDSNKIKKVN